MPTTRPRHMITETDDVAAALDAVSELYPGVSRAEVLRQLVLAGSNAVTAEHGRRGELVRGLAGRHPGLYPPGHLDELRAEWPD